MTMLFLSMPATRLTALFTLSLHDALPISLGVYPTADRMDVIGPMARDIAGLRQAFRLMAPEAGDGGGRRSEEHTSELQSRSHLVCRLLLEKKKKIINWGMK